MTALSPRTTTKLCSAVSQRVRQAHRKAARRAGIERAGTVPASVSMWLGRESWTGSVREWVSSPAFGEVRAALGKRGAISAAVLIIIAVEWAAFADHATGRNVAVTKATIAKKIGCSEKTVQRAWAVLAAGGWATEAARGHGSPVGHTAGNRPSIWHLVSPRPFAEAAADVVDSVPLPAKPGSCLESPVGIHSPSVRGGARRQDCPHENGRARRARRAAPRPLAVQRLAAGLVTPVCVRGDTGGPDARRSPLLAGLDRGGHIGAICDAISAAGIDPEAWSPKALAAALTADGQARGLYWPDRIERPGAFLAARLRALPPRPAEPVAGDDGGRAAGPEEPGGGPAWADSPPVTATPVVLSEAGQMARAEARRIAEQAARRRTTGSGGTTSPREIVVLEDVEDDMGCAVCGSAPAPRRPHLPPRRAHVCDACWAVAAQPTSAPPAASVLSVPSHSLSQQETA
jgi:hypothetical protein